MQRIHKAFKIDSILDIKEKLLIWGNNSNTVVWLDSNNNKKSAKDGLLAIDALQTLKCESLNAFDQLQNFVDTAKDFVFGYLGYDLKNDVEKLSSNNFDGAKFPDLFFFQPLKVIEINQNKIIFKYPDYLASTIDKDWNEIKKATLQQATQHALTIKSRVSKELYTKQVNKAITHIKKGAVYELNYCMEFYAEDAAINPLQTYLDLNKISTPPFATFLKFDELYALSASPERFLKKMGNRLVSEPIKGTAKRDKNTLKDHQLKQALKNNTKEIAENIMIVDLVRNDLSHIAKKASVNVDELCEVYSFKQVHQMISSISATLKSNIHPVDSIKACYPMGSMTGAPKFAAMNFIENLENSKRGIYSGAIGYFTPELDFDFNVVIRSILYNKPNKYVSFSVGSAITAKANAHSEYNECLLKANAMRKVLSK